jgi:hypothetical protein
MIFPEVKIYSPDIYTDFRGDLWTIWNKDKFEYPLNFNHDKVSTSRKHVLRGIHGDSKLEGDLYINNNKTNETYLFVDSTNKFVGINTSQIYSN